MVTIVKGSKTLSIPVGAYKTVYAPAGWVLAEEVKTTAAEKPVKPEKTEKEPKIEEPVVEEAEEDEEDEDVEYVDPEDLLEKPLEELDFDELKILAEYLDINVKGMNTSKALRTAIKKAQK